MAQTLFRSDDTDIWQYGFGRGVLGDKTVSSPETITPTYTTASGTVGGTSVTAGSTAFANGDLVYLMQFTGTGVGNHELNMVKSGGYTTSLMMEKVLKNTYTVSGGTTASIIKIIEYRNLTITSTLSYTTAQQTSGTIIPIFVSNNFINNGTISLNGGGWRQGQTSFEGGLAGRQAFGNGLTTANARTRSANGNGGGGGDGGSSYDANLIGGAGGGGGGNASTGTNGQTGSSSRLGGWAGAAAGNASLTNFSIGGGGGEGGGGPTVRGQNGGTGGGGLIIFARNFDTSGGTVIRANGTNGSTGTLNWDGGGGGGAGGSILIKSQVAALGTNKFQVVGGTGGTNSGAAGDGGAGATGWLHLDYKDSYTGTSSGIDIRQDDSLVANYLSPIIFFL
jgi:hypothetical protein